MPPDPAQVTSLKISEVSTQYDLSRPAVLLLFCFIVFLFQFSLVFTMLDTIGPYNLNGMWITVPDFAERLNQPNSSFERVYARLNGWDGQWYYHIADQGYRCPEIPPSNNPHLCNLSFFPLVPMLGASLNRLGIDLLYALPLVSQLAWFATLLLILCFIRSLTRIQPLHMLGLLLLVSYPGSVYGFIAYSESLLTFLVVVITTVTYWYLEKPRNSLLILLSLACFFMCLVKISGVIVLGLPVLMALLHSNYDGRWFAREQLRVYCASAAGILGILAFLVYCEIRFDDWAIYFKYVGTAWGGTQEGGVSLNPFRIFTGFQWHEYIPLRISNLIVISLPWFILILGAVAFHKRNTTSFPHVALIFTIVALYYFYSTTGNSSHFQNFNIARHMLPVVALLTLSAIPFFNQDIRQDKLAGLILALGGLVAVQFYAQLEMLKALKIGNWVS